MRRINNWRQVIEVYRFGGQGGSRTPDASLFRATINGPNHFPNQQLNSSEWPNYCDHSVTSADVRLASALSGLMLCMLCMFPVIQSAAVEAMLSRVENFVISMQLWFWQMS
jgi:hypothetical protein